MIVCMTLLLLMLVLAIVLGMGALPLGILPSIFLFRDLANGTDASEKSKRRYAFVLWSGLAFAWIVGTLLALFVLILFW